VGEAESTKLVQWEGNSQKPFREFLKMGYQQSNGTTAKTNREEGTKKKGKGFGDGCIKESEGTLLGNRPRAQKA
jgi:hypothetical protein